MECKHVPGMKLESYELPASGKEVYSKVNHADAGQAGCVWSPARLLKALHLFV